jgi:hypothetical protein
VSQSVGFLPGLKERGLRLETAEIIVSQNRSAECTVFPPDATDFERLTTWITAKEGSFTSLEDMR